MRRHIHTTISDESGRYIERKSKELGLNKGAMIDELVRYHKKHESGIRHAVLTEIIDRVVADYNKHELTD